MRTKTLIALLLLACSCGKLKETPTSPGDGIPPDPRATFTRVQNEVFTPSCGIAGCHDPDIQQAGMILTTGRAYAQIVGQPSTESPSLKRIEPGNPDASYLYRKITGGAITGEKMPLVGSIDESKIVLIRDWIRRGAPND
jgi:hypothetical protein